MTPKFKKYFIIFFALMLLSLSFALPVSAKAEEIDQNKICSVTVALAVGDDPIIGAELTAYKVADVSGDLSNAFIALKDDFSSVSVEDGVFDAEAVKNLLKIIDENGIKGVSAVSDESGSLVISDLRPGVYIIRQTKSVNGFSDIIPFAAFIPEIVNDAFVYDIDATPKAESAKLVDIKVKKIWNCGENSHPGEVTVYLLKDGEKVSEVKLNESNNWEYIWENMPASEGYGVSEVQVEGYVAKYSREGYVFTVTNTSSLIQTGQTTWPITVFAVAGIILFAIGYYVLFGKRKQDA